MSGRFAAFSFVDRIIEIEGLKRVTGCFTIPTDVTRFPVSLVAEAIGQLAAWVAMDHVGFTKRPVAALAGETQLFHIPQPGDTLALEVDIESCDDQAIVYRGRARVNGQIVLELLDTLGSMLDTAEFDDPEKLRADFDCLTQTGRAVGAFKGIAPPNLTALQRSEPTDVNQSTDSVQYRLAIPAHAPYFEDHFPKRPVFPATLLLDALLHIAYPLALNSLPGQQSHHSQLMASRITNVKVRAFTPPGAELILFAQTPEWLEDQPDTCCVKVGARSGDKTIAGARIYFSKTS